MTSKFYLYVLPKKKIFTGFIACCILYETQNILKSISLDISIYENPSTISLFLFNKDKCTEF